MEKFKDLVDIVDLALKQRASNVDMESFNADLVKLFPASEGYKIKSFYPEGEFVFDIHGKTTWRIRIKMDKSVDESSVEFSISILSSNILARFFRNLKSLVYFPDSRCYNRFINLRRTSK